jgi:DNA modification methylase
MKSAPIPRLDQADELREKLLPHCRLGPGEIWHDSEGKHRVACLDAADQKQIQELLSGARLDLAIHDPPYNLIAFETRAIHSYIEWCSQWVRITEKCLAENASVYVWLGADQNNGFQPLPDFMIMMRDINELRPRSFITMRNQRGYGTQKNWMAIRQELVFYTKGDPYFQVQYTEIPKILRGYYKTVDGKLTENLERSKSENIRAGNVWIDVQQIFYRMEENVAGCYAQKPLKAIERILLASSAPQAAVGDFFAHSGTTLLACEKQGRRCFTCDIDPIYCEIAIRRLERFRTRGLLGWQNSNPFEDVLDLPDSEQKKTRDSFNQSYLDQGTLF